MRPRAILDGLRRARANQSKVLAINQRNLGYVYPLNQREHFPIADNKLLTKEIMVACGVPVPKTYRAYGYFGELTNLEEDLGPYPEFVIKPARGRAGGGIIVIAGRDGDDWMSVSGRRYDLTAVKGQISDIIFGIHSFGTRDEAIVEQRIQQDHRVTVLVGAGLADVRVILCRGVAVQAMMRLPTLASGGRANLHQGAMGAGVDLQSGRTIHAVQGGHPIDHHPDTGQAVVGFDIPFWDDLRKIADKTAQAVPLGYLGIDLALSPDGPVLLEINARPGLEIQSANQEGLAGLLAEIP